MAVVKSIALAKQTSRLVNLLNLLKDQLESFIKACKENDIELAQKIARNDLNINIEFHYIIDKSTWILTQHVILGEELRMLLAYNSIAKEFERLGDVISGLAINLVKSKDAVVSNDSIVNELTFIKNQLLTLEEIIKNPIKEKIIENLDNSEENMEAFIKIQSEILLTKLQFLKNQNK